MERFESKYIKRDNGCWEWIASLRSKKTGYGAFKFKNKIIDAHRVSYTLYKGEIPKGLLVCHKCDNRLCVNPDHLFLGTYKENYKDAFDKGRIKPKPKKHPSIGSYDRGCRCEECVKIAQPRLLKKKLKNRDYRKNKALGNMKT